jgi:hypothetical protein
MAIRKGDLIAAIKNLEELAQFMQVPNLNFDVYLPNENDNRKNDYYYIISNRLPSYSFTINRDKLKEFGEKIDYESIINAKKYNL